MVATPRPKARAAGRYHKPRRRAMRIDPADGRLLRLPGDYRQQSLLVSSVCVVQYIFRVGYWPFRTVDGRIPYF